MIFKPVFRIADEKVKENVSHVELLRRSLVDKTEKISHLRKELDETRNLLNEEKNLNSNIKTRKVSISLLLII